jgi:hypothetical protein
VRDEHPYTYFYRQDFVAPVGNRCRLGEVIGVHQLEEFAEAEVADYSVCCATLA